MRASEDASPLLPDLLTDSKQIKHPRAHHEEHRSETFSDLEGI